MALSSSVCSRSRQKPGSSSLQAREIKSWEQTIRRKRWSFYLISYHKSKILVVSWQVNFCLLFDKQKIRKLLAVPLGGGDGIKCSLLQGLVIMQYKIIAIIKINGTGSGSVRINRVAPRPSNGRWEDASIMADLKSSKSKCVNAQPVLPGLLTASTKNTELDGWFFQSPLLRKLTQF